MHMSQGQRSDHYGCYGLTIHMDRLKVKIWFKKALNVSIFRGICIYYIAAFAVLICVIWQSRYMSNPQCYGWTISSPRVFRGQEFYGLLQYKISTQNSSWTQMFLHGASYQIRKIAGCACAGNAGNVFPRRRFQRKPLVSDPGMHHGTCVTHVPWCMSGSLACGDGENVPGIPGACAPASLRIWQEAHALYISIA